jgi:hypothetical protein
MTRIPKTLAAVKQLDLDQWEIGDALNLECGVGRPVSFREAAEELADKGYGEYSISYLSRLANTAASFPKVARRATFSWSAHCEAGSPAMLKAIVDAAKEEKVKPTAELARSFVKKAREREDAAEEDEIERKLAGVSRGTGVPSPPPEPNMVLKGIEWVNAGERARMAAEKAEQEISERVLDPELIEDVAESWLAAANACRAVADAARKKTASKRGHIREVANG